MSNTCTKEVGNLIPKAWKHDLNIATLSYVARDLHGKCYTNGTVGIFQADVQYLHAQPHTLPSSTNVENGGHQAALGVLWKFLESLLEGLDATDSVMQVTCLWFGPDGIASGINGARNAWAWSC